MATKANTKAKEILVDEEIATQEYTEVVEKVTPVKKEPQKPKWEIKDRTYVIADNHSPLTYTLQSRHSVRYPLLWFNKETGEQEELRYATNQNSPLVSEQKGQVTLGHIMFENGVLTVPKERQNLQKLLSLYHPALNNKYKEFDPEVIAEDNIDDLELEVMALNAAFEMDIDMAEAIVRVDVGSKVSKMSSKEIKRDLLLMAKKNPALFLDLANDENIPLRNLAIRASEVGIIRLSQDHRTFTWGENGRKLMTVPFDENPFSAMAAFFKTDEGVEIFKAIEKKLK